MLYFMHREGLKGFKTELLLKTAADKILTKVGWGNRALVYMFLG